MSTKIYNGYMLPKMSMDELLSWCKKHQAELQKLQKERVIKVMKALKESSNKDVGDVKIAIVDMISDIKRTNQRDPIVDFCFEATFFPLEDRILVITFTEQRNFEDYFQSIPEVKYYGYWDNTDPDEKCTNEEWKQRKEDWDQVLLNGNGVPSENGFTFRFLDDGSMTVWMLKREDL